MSSITTTEMARSPTLTNSQGSRVGDGQGMRLRSTTMTTDGWMCSSHACSVAAPQLYRNEGAGRFTDVTLQVLGKTPWGGLGAKVFDFDNDGRLTCA